MHDDEIDHVHLPEEQRAEIARAIWAQESLELHTVGIDIGSSTSHLVFARLLLQRRSQELSSRFIVTMREITWRSPIMLTWPMRLPVFLERPSAIISSSV